jgi:hypothetical protein
MALMTFGAQKMRGKSTKRSIRDAMLIGSLGQLGGASMGVTPFGSAGTAGTIQGLGQTSAAQGLRSLFPQFASKAPASANMLSSGLNTSQMAAMNLSPAELAKQEALKKVTQPTGIMETLKGLLPTSDAGKIALGAAALPLLSGDDGPDKMYLPIPNQAYTKYANSGAGGTPTGFMTRDYATGINSPLVQPGNYVTAEEILGDQPTQQFKAVEMNTGGLASIARFNEGGQVLPSKITHDENDVNNYERANGFVLDSTGQGKDHEDTMLAQLADGEFVSRSHAVLGAGIIAGANPSDKSDQRKQGAKFFYDQQKQFKRIFDLINANKNRTDSVH